MTEKFKDIYRIPSARLKGWNYSNPGWYYITICTANRECLFGKIIGNDMHLSPAGEIVKEEFERSLIIRKELALDIYKIMPDHLHAIVIIESKGGRKNSGCIDPGDRIIDSQGNVVDSQGNIIDRMEARVGMHGHVETHGRASLRDQHLSKPKNEQMPMRSPRSVSSFVAGFKSAATKRINILRGTPRFPVWQTRFYDVIIRDDKQLNKIRKYIEDNPANWQRGEMDHDLS